MCIIVNKNRGIELPKMETLENCFDYNSDGAGMMYNLDGNVYIEKGFMDFKEFYARLMELDEEIGLKERGLVMHFRITTSGGTNQGNCHPYPISRNVNDLKALRFTTDLGMAHNGIMSKYNPAPNSTLNDTQTFIKNYLTDVYESYKEFLTDERLLQAIEYEVGSKLSFLDSEGNITTVGKFQEFEGCWYSNDTYQDIYSSSYWNKWGWNTINKSSFSSAKELDVLNEYDLTPISGKVLDLEEFCEVLDIVYIPADGTEIEVNGTKVVCDGNYCLDMGNNVYEICYTSYVLYFLGMAYDEAECVKYESPKEEDNYEFTDEYEDFYKDFYEEFYKDFYDSYTESEVY